MPQTPKAYRLNLIRQLREQEHKAERRRRTVALSGLACFAVLVLVLLYSGLTVWNMERVLAAEQRKLENIRSEYQKYTAARLIVDKNDLELLNTLQGRGIFWTKKLAAMAKHLPDNYWITQFSFANGELRVSGHGYASSRQDQLLVLDGYLGRLRRDTSFSEVFKTLHLNTAERREEQGAGTVAFDFSALTTEAAKEAR